MGAQAQPYHHGNLKQALLDKALDHLRLHGPEKISLRALARDVGVSQTAPYRHFEDKTALLAALATEGFKRLYNVSNFAINIDGTAADALQMSGKAYIHFALDNPELYRLMFGPLLSPDENFGELEEAGANAFNVMVGIVKRGISTGEFVDKDPLLVANSTWAMVHGISSLMLDRRFDCVEGGISESVLDESLNIVLLGLKTR
ncbi:TetR/AcrR family transcriptional regulator [Alkalimarinus sediminis]|uniref:TetR/AcrR family transcriptional regulator n=1 Tax=Alkalimarinus sediminis TaxID=1632866 RepID=A0A9E8KIA4_9ALTE|nr:TetR/AcrR family transcriptional regulator [Alkalimarinus sediminis]UZW73746.1 TetR/AcrR family transcriptional regulator [Alkalimarinus sediminis]